MQEKCHCHSHWHSRCLCHSTSHPREGLTNQISLSPGKENSQMPGECWRFDLISVKQHVGQRKRKYRIARKCSLTKNARNRSYRRVLVCSQPRSQGPLYTSRERTLGTRLVCSPTFPGARLLPWFAKEILAVKRSAFIDLKVHGIPEHPQQIILLTVLLEMFTVVK